LECLVNGTIDLNVVIAVGGDDGRITEVIKICKHSTGVAGFKLHIVFDSGILERKL